MLCIHICSCSAAKQESAVGHEEFTLKTEASHDVGVGVWRGKSELSQAPEHEKWLALADDWRRLSLDMRR